MWGNTLSKLRELAARETLPDEGTLYDLRHKIEEVRSKFSYTANTVFGSGPLSPDVMVIGEAPGREEDETGIPFVGRSGKLLDEMLNGIDVKRSDVYITNMVPWRPPENRTPTDQEIAIMLPLVREHISLVQPRFLLLMGSSAVRGLLCDKHTPMRELVGKWHEVSGIPTMPNYHPSYLLRIRARKREAWNAMVLLGEAL